MDNTARKIIAKNVEKLRNNTKLKREELSLALGFDNSYISKLKKGKINITIDRLETIAKYFNMKIVELLKEN